MKGRPQRVENPFAQAAASQLDALSMPLGITNLTRRFYLQTGSGIDNYNTPSYFLQRTRPLAAFLQGWSKSDSGADFDNSSLGDALSVDESDVDKVLYPYTRYSATWEEVLWPVILNMLQSGLGSGGSLPAHVNQQNIIRYFAHALYCYGLCYWAMVINYIAYRFDWKSVEPFTENVPPSLYTLAKNYQAQDADLADVWMPLFNRVEELVIPPALVSAVQRVLSPMLTLGLGPKLIVPFPDYGQQEPGDWLADGMHPGNLVKEHLDFINVGLYETENMLKNFVPFPMIISDPWRLDQFPLVDPFRWGGMENCTVADVDIFGSGSVSHFPSRDECLTFVRDSNGWGNGVYFSPVAKVDWNEFQFAGAFEVDTTSTIGNDFSLLTPHQYSGYWILSDDYSVDNNLTWLGINNAEDFTDNAARYYKTAPAKRWVAATARGIDEGFLVPGSVASVIPFEGAVRSLRFAMEADWNYDVLRAFTFIAMGSQLREIRPTFQRMVGAALAQRKEASAY